MTNTTRLRGCPWCGVAPTLKARDDVSAAHNFYHTSLVSISCINDTCPVRPVLDIEERDSIELSKAKAISAWGTRAESDFPPWQPIQTEVGMAEDKSDPQIFINHTAGTNEIVIRLTYPNPGHAGQKHRGWLRAWKSGRLAQLIDVCTWE